MVDVESIEHSSPRRRIGVGMVSFDLSTKSNRKFENTKLTYSCISLGPLNVPVCARERVVESSMTHRNEIEMCKRNYIHHDIVDDQAHTLTHPCVVVAGIEQTERRVFQLWHTHLGGSVLRILVFPIEHPKLNSNIWEWMDHNKNKENKLNQHQLAHGCRDRHLHSPFAQKWSSFS